MVNIHIHQFQPGGAVMRALKDSTSTFLMLYEPTRNVGETRDQYLQRFRAVNQAALDHAEPGRVGADRPSRDDQRSSGNASRLARSWPAGGVCKRAPAV